MNPSSISLFRCNFSPLQLSIARSQQSACTFCGQPPSIFSSGAIFLLGQANQNCNFPLSPQVKFISCIKIVNFSSQSLSLSSVTKPLPDCQFCLLSANFDQAQDSVLSLQQSFICVSVFPLQNGCLVSLSPSPPTTQTLSISDSFSCKIAFFLRDCT